MNICEECGLPMKICNALAMYRDAVKEYKGGRINEAEGYAKSAQEWYDEYYAEDRETALATLEAAG